MTREMPPPLDRADATGRPTDAARRTPHACASAAAALPHGDHARLRAAGTAARRTVTEPRRAAARLRLGPVVRSRLATALVLLAAAACTPGCASDGLAAGEAPTSTRPAELDSMRETLADRRAETREMMETTLVRPDRTGAGEPSTWGSDVLSFLDDAAGATLDVLKMKYLGLW